MLPQRRGLATAARVLVALTFRPPVQAAVAVRAYTTT